VREAEKADPSVRDSLRQNGLEEQLRWGCPIRTGKEPDRDALDDKHREVLTATENLTGVRCSTCPNFYLRLPWVHEAIAKRRWRDKGQLQLVTGNPSRALVRAIDAIDRGDNERQADDYKRRERDREAAAEEAKRARENGSRQT
jgi:hypothetical protein